MNSKRVETLCGKRATKGKPGTKGMSTAEIDKFIKESIPQNMKNQFTRMQKKDKDRASLCKLLAKFKAGQDLLKQSGTPSPVAKKKKSASPSKNDPFAAMKNAKKPMKFQLMNENGEVESNSNRNNGNENNRLNAVNYGEENVANQNAAYKLAGRAEWARIKRAEPDPFKGNGGSLRGRTKAVLERKMRRLQKAGKLPAGASRGNLMKEMMVAKPKNTARKAREVASVRRRTPPTKVQQVQRQMMKMNGTFSEATGRRETRPKRAISRQMYSPTQIREARRRANVVYSRFNRAGLVPNMPRGSANENSKAEYTREIENLKKELRNAELALMPKGERTKKASPKLGFSQVRTGENASNQLSRLKKMKERNKTATQKRRQRILQKLANMVPKKPKYNAKFAPNMQGTPNSNASASPVVERGMATNANSIQNLRNRRNRGEKLKSAERRLLNVANALAKK